MGVLLARQDLEALLLRHARQLWSYLLRKARDPHLAVGLTQGSFLRLAKQRHKEPIKHVDAYLYRTAYNLAIDHYRQERRRHTETRPNDDLAGFVTDQPGLEEPAMGANALTRLRGVVTELLPRTREIFRFNRPEGLTHVEVARHLEISGSSVQKHLTHALAHVTQTLGDSRRMDYQVLPVRAFEPQ